LVVEEAVTEQSMHEGCPYGFVAVLSGRVGSIMPGVL